MDMFVVRGGRPLRGRVKVGGAKNAALPIMAAALMSEGPVVLRDVPELVDVSTLANLMATLGVLVERRADRSLLIDIFDESQIVADYELVRKMRASICVLGPLLAKRKRAIVSLPGGCNIGDRPIDLHLKGLKALGANIIVDRGYVIAEAQHLKGANIFLGGSFGSTVTGTCNVLAAATLAEGVTTIESAACEPEDVDFGNFLQAMGAKIDGLGTPFLRIDGVEKLRSVDYEIIPDRIEAVTLMIGAVMTGGDVTLENQCLPHMTAIIEKLREVGVPITISDTDAKPRRCHIRVVAPDKIRSTELSALPYPGIPTDVQAQFMAMLALSDGISVVTDKVFPDRFMHVPELVRLGARMHREGQSAIINGVSTLRGACVMASDLRASAALVLAAMAADGETVVRRIYHLDRGYERLEARLNSLGADIARVEDSAANVPDSLRLCDMIAPPSVRLGQPLMTPSSRQLRIDAAQSSEELIDASTRSVSRVDSVEQVGG